VAGINTDFDARKIRALGESWRWDQQSQQYENSRSPHHRSS
jgi:hypothetical protein